MKLTRKLMLEILSYASEQIARKDRESYELIVNVLRHAADTIEKFHKP